MMMQQKCIHVPAVEHHVESPGKVTPWNATVDIVGITALMQLDTEASLCP